jgi:hypothetical protein
MTTRPTIFLDMDGVLNAHEWTEQAGSCDIRRDCVAELNRIIEAVQPRFVLSSAWRYMISCGAMTCAGFRYMLHTHGVHRRFDLIGITPADEEIKGRGRQIAAWWDLNGDQGSYVVLDDEDHDDDIERLHPGRFVRTAKDRGLTPEDADRVIGLLRNGSQMR